MLRRTIQQKNFLRASARLSSPVAKSSVSFSTTKFPGRDAREQYGGYMGKLMVGSNLRALKKKADTTPTDENILKYVTALVPVSPKEAVTYIERGWENGVVPKKQVFLQQYVKAVGYLNKIETLNLSSLVKMLEGNKGQGALAETPIRAELPNLSASLGAPFSAGTSPAEPLYIAQQENVSWRSQLWKLVKFTIGTFMIFSFIGSVFVDEKGGANSFRSLGVSSVVHQAEKTDKTFEDVVGIDEAKAELQEIVLYLKDPKRFTRLGGKLPKGVLLTGPPGTGKTLLARAIAGEAGVPFFYSSGSEFEEMYVGVGAKRVRELFDAAKNKSPCIIFIDEIDAIGGSRNVKDQSAMKMTLNQLLVEMDGFQQNAGVIVIAATNFMDSLDSALLRPGRFDKHVDVPMPDIGGRKAILQLYSKKVPMDKDVDLEQLARGTPGFSGAELFNLINQAALKASIDGRKAVSMHCLEYAKDKLMMGAERKSAVISPETLRMTAFHEAGHALVALKTDGADPIHKATIMPRGRALGMVMQLPDGDQTSMSRKQMIARLDVCMGGRVAEELIYGYENVTSGASSDIQQATRLAKAMVTKYGLSEKVGVIFFDEKSKQSGSTQAAIDDEVKELLTGSYNRAKTLLETHKKELTLIAEGLLEYESMSGSEIVDIIKGVKPVNGKRSQRPSRASDTILLPSKGSTVTQNASAAVTTIQSSQDEKTVSNEPKTNGADLLKRRFNPFGHSESSVPSACPENKTESNSTPSPAREKSSTTRGPPKV